MPDLRVTDELGQPLHAPCILSLTIPVSLSKQPESIISQQKSGSHNRKIILVDRGKWEPTDQILYRLYPRHHLALLVVFEFLTTPLS